MKRSVLQVGLMSACLLVLFTTGCKKKVAATPPPPPPPAAKNEPPPPPAAKPSISSFAAEPSSVVKGSPSTLRWSVSGASDISIDQGVGSVQASGTRQVYPSSDTTYTLIARGVGGTSSATVTVRVTQPQAPPPPPPPTARRSASEFLSQEVNDAFFDYDKFDIREDARGVLTSDAGALKRFFGDDNYTGTNIVIEGHCDERGSDAYNVALGDKRAQAALDFLKGLGVAESRMKTVSYGKERPQCAEGTEACWQKNRRVHFSAQ